MRPSSFGTLLAFLVSAGPLVLGACGDADHDSGTSEDTASSEGDEGGGDEGGETGTDDTGEDCTDPTTWYYDADGDGFGDPDLPTEACTAPAGYVADADDCDDLRFDVHPGVEDICNQIDDDCDDSIDEDAATSTWYADLDGDGFGDPISPSEVCAAPEAHVADDSDCDDGDETINPDAEEICGDGIDSDCDGLKRICLPEGERDLEAEAIRVEGLESGEHLATEVLVEDIDLDGVDDLLLSTPEANSNTGVIYAWLGPITADTDTSAADLVFEGDLVDDQFGNAMLGGIDANGDGYEDLVVSAWEADDGTATNEGHVYFFSGPLTGGELMSADADYTLEGYNILRLGADIDLGDYDGDGDLDLVMGAPNTVTTAHTSGTAHVMTLPYDASDGYVLTATTLLIAPDQKTLPAEAVASLDWDGDGVSDTAVVDELYETGGYGITYVVLGPYTDYTYFDEDGLYVSGNATGQQLGSALATGELDGDGYDDLLLGAPGDSNAATDGGAVYLVSGGGGSMPNLNSADARIRCDLEGAMAGSEVEVVEDLDDDGLPEVLLGAPMEDDGAGTTWLFVTPLAGAYSTSDDAQAAFNTGDYDGVGTSVGLSMELTGDEYPDIVVGAPTDQASSEAGAAWIFPIDGGY